MFWVHGTLKRVLLLLAYLYCVLSTMLCTCGGPGAPCRSPTTLIWDSATGLWSSVLFGPSFPWAAPSPCLSAVEIPRQDQSWRHLTPLAGQVTGRRPPQQPCQTSRSLHGSLGCFHQPAFLLYLTCPVRWGIVVWWLSPPFPAPSLSSLTGGNKKIIIILASWILLLAGPNKCILSVNAYNDSRTRVISTL